MKIASSLKSLKKRDLNSKLVKRRGKLYIINKIDILWFQIRRSLLKITIPKAPIKKIRILVNRLPKINVKGKRYTRYINKFVK